MKKVSIAMSFIAALAAATVFGLAVYRDKGHVTVFRTGETVKPFFGANFTQIKSNIQTGHIVNEPKEEFKLPPVISVSVKSDPPTVGPTQSLQTQAPEILYTADSSIKFAVGDMLTIPAEDQKYMRYFSLYNIPKVKRKEYAATFSFICNSLSRRKKIYIPQFVGVSDETVIRVDIRRYEWNPETWKSVV